MREHLISLGFTEKQANVYLALLEYGTQTASVIAKRVGLPRPTVLYLFKGLLERGYIRKTQKGRTQYFHAEPGYLNDAKSLELAKQSHVLVEAIPLLEEFKSPYSSPPRIQFFEGIENCKKAYLMLLDSKKDIYEFAAHDDLVKMGEEFMADFIEERARRGIVLHAICKVSDLHQSYGDKNKEHRRTLKMFDPEFGQLYSSIAIFENKVLLLNLYRDAFAILIENREMADTLKTIHTLVGISL